MAALAFSFSCSASSRAARACRLLSFLICFLNAGSVLPVLKLEFWSGNSCGHHELHVSNGSWIKAHSSCGHWGMRMIVRTLVVEIDCVGCK